MIRSKSADPEKCPFVSAFTVNDTTEQLKKTMTRLTDPAWFNSGAPRLTVSTVNVKTGRMHYWDSARMPLSLEHVLASAALPISFPAVRIDGDPYWDGGMLEGRTIFVQPLRQVRHPVYSG